jgi:hypothetical protein
VDQRSSVEWCAVSLASATATTVTIAVPMR